MRCLVPCGVLLSVVVAITPAQSGGKPADAAAEYAALTREYEAAVAEWRQLVRAAKAEEQKARKEGRPAVGRMPVAPTDAFVTRAEELAKQFAGTDDAVPFLAFVCEKATAQRAAVKRAVVALGSDNAKSPAIGMALDHLESAFNMGARKEALALLDKVVVENASADAKAHALLVRGRFRLSVARTAGDRAAAAEDLRAVAAMTKVERLVQRAKDALFEIEHLQIGCKAPEIAAEDTDGVAMKLGEFRGKVILLDFWGFW